LTVAVLFYKNDVVPEKVSSMQVILSVLFILSLMLIYYWKMKKQKNKGV